MTEEFTAPAEPSPIAETPTEPSERQPYKDIDASREQVFDLKPKDTKVMTRREALEKAFKSIDDEPAQKTEAELAKTDDGSQPRGPDGKFVAKEPSEPPAEAAKTPEKAPEAQKTDADTPKDKAPISEAPARFSPDAKQAWKDAPEPVRGEIQRAISELESGLQQKDEQLAPLKPFFDLAQQQGVTVHDTLQRYVNMETALRQDLRGGLSALAQNFGMTLEDMVAKATGGESVSTDKDRTIVALQQQIQDLSQQVSGVSQSMQQTQQDSILAEVNAFADANPRFEELSEQIQYEIEASQALGRPMTLQEAYEKADRLNPAPPSPVEPAPPAPPAQPRQARSVTGAPNAGSNPGNRQPSQNRTEAITRAFSQVGL